MPLITAANAREMAAKAHAAKAQRSESLRQAVLTLEQSPDVDYCSKRLARVRSQLDLIDAELSQGPSKDSKRYRDLVESAHRLAEQERILRNAPLPGSYRPVQERQPRRQAGPVAPLSQPVQPVAQAPIVASADDYSI